MVGSYFNMLGQNNFMIKKIGIEIRLLLVSNKIAKFNK